MKDCYYKQETNDPVHPDQVIKVCWFVLDKEAEKTVSDPAKVGQARICWHMDKCGPQCPLYEE